MGLPIPGRRRSAGYLVPSCGSCVRPRAGYGAGLLPEQGTPRRCATSRPDPWGLGRTPLRRARGGGDRAKTPGESLPGQLSGMSHWTAPRGTKSRSASDPRLHIPAPRRAAPRPGWADRKIGHFCSQWGGASVISVFASGWWYFRLLRVGRIRLLNKLEFLTFDKHIYELSCKLIYSPRASISRWWCRNERNNSRRYPSLLENCLRTTLKTGQVLLIDKATFHKRGRISQLI